MHIVNSYYLVFVLPEVCTTQALDYKSFFWINLPNFDVNWFRVFVLKIVELFEPIFLAVLINKTLHLPAVPYARLILRTSPIFGDRDIV